MTKFCGNSIFQIFYKNPLNAPVSAFWNKNIPNFVLFLTSNRFGNFGLFNVDLSGIGTDYRKEITLSIVFIRAFHKISPIYWSNFFQTSALLYHGTKLKKRIFYFISGASQLILINNWKIVKNSLENCFRSIWSLKLVARQDVRRGDLCGDISRCELKHI